MRAALPADAPAIAKLCDQLGYPSTADQVTHRLRRLEQDSADVVLVATLSGGEIVGWIHVGVVLRVMAEPFAEICGLVVDEPHRGTGIGRAMLDAATRWAGENGCTRMRIRSNVLRQQTHRVYTDLGYELSKTQHVFNLRIPDEEP
jgi:GNAT superfamily N-acetyltransferase